jgi:hypothetical protein
MTSGSHEQSQGRRRRHGAGPTAEINCDTVPTVLIAAPAYLGVLKQRVEFKDALAFADTDALRAFAAIARQRAEVVVVDAAFAATSRGTALINRIKADPLMVDCDVRVLTNDEATAPSAVARDPAAAPAPAVAPTPDVTAPDRVEPSVATQFAMTEGAELLVDGIAATLVDLSVSGAQIVSTTSLKPHQRVRLTLPGFPPIQVNGEIGWAMFEMPAGGPRYRASVVFFSPDTARLAAFIDANKK